MQNRNVYLLGQLDYLLHLVIHSFLQVVAFYVQGHHQQLGPLLINYSLHSPLAFLNPAHYDLLCLVLFLHLANSLLVSQSVDHLQHHVFQLLIGVVGHPFSEDDIVIDMACKFAHLVVRNYLHLLLCLLMRFTLLLFMLLCLSLLGLLVSLFFVLPLFLINLGKVLTLPFLKGFLHLLNKGLSLFPGCSFDSPAALLNGTYSLFTIVLGYFFVNLYQMTEFVLLPLLFLLLLFFYLVQPLDEIFPLILDPIPNLFPLLLKLLFHGSLFLFPLLSPGGFTPCLYDAIPIPLQSILIET